MAGGLEGRNPMRRVISIFLSILLLVGYPALARLRRGSMENLLPDSMKTYSLQAQNPLPALDLTGTWTGVTGFSGRKDVFTITLAKKGESYAGTITDAAGLMKQAPLEDVRITGGGLAFSFTGSLPSQDLCFQAILNPENGRLVGTWTAEVGDVGSFSMERKEGPASSFPAANTGRSGMTPYLIAAVQQVESLVADEWEKEKLGSVTVGIISGPNLIWAKSFGFADMEQKVPATPDFVYRIGSMTKQFTGLMLLQLVEAGKVHFSEPVDKFFPEIKSIQMRQPWYASPTFIQLATMTAGLDREPGGPPTFLAGPMSEWEKILIGALPQVKYVSEPDTGYLYSNVSIAVLGAALGRVAGRPYTEYVRERILAPLGMNHTVFELDSEMCGRLAKGYDVGRDGKPDPEGAARDLAAGRGYKVPNGGLFTTVKDLARFVSFQLGEGPETVLSRKVLVENMSRPVRAMLDLRAGYGIGFMVNRRRGLVIYGHAGEVAGYSAAAEFDRASGAGVVVLRNVAGGRLRVGVLADQILEAIVAAMKRAA
jgi:CubicO group peptidase (beta-lactamase class C family)